MASTPSPFPQNYTFARPQAGSISRRKPPPTRQPLPSSPSSRCCGHALSLNYPFSPREIPTCGRKLTCKAAEVSVTEEESSASGGGGGGENWVPVVPLSALPKGERRVIIQDGETILLLWYKDEVFAIENRSPAEGAYSEGLINAKLTQDGCIVCPTTESTFDLRTGAVRDWYPNNPVMEGGASSDASAEIVFSGKAQPGVTATDVNIEEVRMVVDEDLEGFGFNVTSELINGKAAAIGFLLLLDFELLTGKGLLKGTGFLDFIYSVAGALNK
ncbi:Rieske domain-containing protein [Citrus sinensis]|uniref:Rieske domain-containing protein n=1 Tax=Citrus sinensis TaxID=2711 RepID=A0A067E983_CITSI|nr:uncharacterized protein LOC102619889 isoform X2 [Citrus sinensis]KAH9725448.1 Rieske domain-containing protein [Citrus sinensis]KDO51724.1 hypothetical protein CISIN_1g022394mg [Citrus sinensis]